MHVPDKEFAGNAQLVKSARIREAALLLGPVHKDRSAIIIASLSAYCAYMLLVVIHISLEANPTQDCAQTGLESSADRLQASLEF